MQENEIGFSELGVESKLLQALKDLKFVSPTEIQLKSIPLLIEGNCDYVGQAQTGTGKTAAFSIPLLQNMEPAGKKPQALVLAPTRELALQISDEIYKFSKYKHVEKVNICGGMNYRPQLEALRSGKLQLVIGTPGRVIDMMDRGALDLSEIKTIVLDEADEMLNMGFWEDVQRIVEGAGEQRQLWMFSATMPKQIKKLIEKSFRDPVFVNTKTEQVSNADIEQSYYLVKDKYKLNALTQVLDLIDGFYGVIFCETRQQTKDLGFSLMDLNYNVSVLHGDLSQSERMSAMRNFKKGKTKVLICTDVAARGIDVDNLSHVINYGLPRDKESYVHRIGRTGRAGNKGIAISIIDRADIGRLRKIEHLQGAQIKKDKLPDIRTRKQIFLQKRTKKFDNLMYQLSQEKENYFVDETFGDFENRFDELSKSDTLKLIFNSWFKNDLRRMDELEDIELDIAKENQLSSRSRRGGGRKFEGSGRGDGGRRGRGGRGGRSRSRDEDRDSGRRRDRRRSSSEDSRRGKSNASSEDSRGGRRNSSEDSRRGRKFGDNGGGSSRPKRSKSKSGGDGSSMFFSPNQKKKRKQELNQRKSR